MRSRWPGPYAAITASGVMAWGMTPEHAKLCAVLAAIGRAVAVSMQPRGVA